MMLRGFSFIEVTIALGVFAVLAPGLFFLFTSLGALQAASRSLVSTIDEAAASTTLFIRAAVRNESIVSAFGLPDPHTWKVPDALHEAKQEYGVRITSPGQPLASCDPFVSASWKTLVADIPRFLSSTDLLRNYPADSYQISDIAWSSGMTVIAIGATTAPTSPTIAFMPMRRYGELSSAVAAFDNASSSRVGYATVVTSGTDAYAANRFSSTGQCVAGSCAQIHHYSFDTEPVLERTALLATSTPPFALRVGGGTAGATALAVDSGLLAVGLERTERGMEFNVLRASDLNWLGGIRIGRSVSAISLRDGRAYIATDDPDRELVIINLSTPSAPYIEETWNAPGARGFGLGSAVSAFGNTVVLGRSYVANADELVLLTHHLSQGVGVVNAWNPGTASRPESIRSLEVIDWIAFALGIRSLSVIDYTEGQGQSRTIAALPAGWEGVSLQCVGSTILVGLVNPSEGTSAITRYRSL